MPCGPEALPKLYPNVLLNGQEPERKDPVPASFNKTTFLDDFNKNTYCF